MYVKYFDIMMQSQLFQNVSISDLEFFMKCMKPKIKFHKKDEIIYMPGCFLSDIILVVKGCVKIQRDEAFGIKNLMELITPGKCFGMAYNRLNRPLNISVITTAPSTILYFDGQRIHELCYKSCTCHQLIIQNLISIYADKIMMLSNKVHYMQMKTIRSKLSLYLLNACDEQNHTFTIHLNKTLLSEYLAISRPAMVTELSKMKKDGIIDYDRNCYKILNIEALKENF